MIEAYDIESATTPLAQEDLEGNSFPSQPILHLVEPLKDEETPPLTVGSSDPSITTPIGGEEKEEKGTRIVTSAKLLEQCRAVLSDTSEQLWGYNLRARGVTLFVGETSAGKTTFLHNLAYHLAKGEEFAGLTPPRPLRVLYLDYESGEYVIAEHLTAIGTAEGWDFFDLQEVIRDENLSKELIPAIVKGKYDVVIIDSLMEAFPVDDENDNSEGAEQMLAVREIARQTDAAILTVHNAGQRGGKKKKGTEKFLGRGATVRSDKADVVINYTVKSQTERQLLVAKSRIGNLGEEVILRFEGELGFEVVGGGEGDGTVVEVMAKAILGLYEKEALGGRRELKRAAIMTGLGIEKDDVRAQTLDRALKKLVIAGKLRKISQGVYALPE